MATKFKLKKGDKVIVTTGKNKGKTGEIKKVLVKESRVIVDGVNLVKRHTKATQTKEGGIISKEAPLHISNVAYLDPKENKATRLGFKLEGDKKIRVAKKSGTAIA